MKLEFDISVTFIIPAYNEELVIESVVRGLISELEALAIKNEIILVNDGSTDKTGTIIKSLIQELGPRNEILLLENDVNRGYGYSLKKGAKVAKYDFICFYDADGQHLSNQLVRLIAEVDSQTDLIIGTRTSNDSSPNWRKPGKVIIKKTAEYIARTKFPDLFSGMRIWKTSSFQSVEALLPSGFSLSTTSTIAATFQDFRIKWIDVTMRKRSGKSSATAFDGFRILLLLIRISVLFSPLKVFLPIAFCIFVFGIFLIGNSYAETGMSSIRGLVVLLFSLVIALQGLLVDQVSSLRRGEVVKKIA
jgi:glycosyltransferase involved in cell wall biosynthesis